MKGIQASFPVLQVIEIRIQHLTDPGDPVFHGVPVQEQCLGRGNRIPFTDQPGIQSPAVFLGQEKWPYSTRL